MQIAAGTPYATLPRRVHTPVSSRTGQEAAVAKQPMPRAVAGAPGASRVHDAARVRSARAAADDEMSQYPDSGPLAGRFLEFDERVREIRRIDATGGALSTEERAALRFYDKLKARLAFLREPGEPSPAARVTPPPDRPVQPAPPVDHGPTEVRYVGGVKIRSDYTLQDVLSITANAAKSPFAAFVASARDLTKKARDGEALSAQEEETIYRYAGIVDAFVSLTRAGGAMQLTGAALDGLNSMLDGKPADPDVLAGVLTDTRGAVATRPGSPPRNGSRAQDNTSTTEAWEVKPWTTTPWTATSEADGPGSKASSPVAPLFDFPRFSIAFPLDADGVQTAHVVRKPAFNPPQRLPDGQTGYPLGPTRPPHLPDEVPSGPVAGPNGTSRTGARRRTRPPGGSMPPPAVPPRSASAPAQRGAGVGDLKRIASKGPISVQIAQTPLEDALRVGNLEMPLFYYRSDKDIEMRRPRPVRKTSYDERRDVLIVGGGEHATSYVANSKINAGRFWGNHPATQLAGAHVIELGNGREGVGAIKLPFANVRPGATVIVSGGAMNGCTMLFASDGRSLYAYHAGSTETASDWRTARDGAQGIVHAHTTMGPKTQRSYKWLGTNSDLIVVGRQYPFSALIYSGRVLGNAEALVGASALLGAVGGVEQPVPNAHLHVPRHAYGPRQGLRWHMMTFNYSERDPNLRTVGTAEAVVSKDLNGAVTVRVLAEKGKLDRASSIGQRGDSISYRYKTVDSDSATYFVPR